MNKYNVLIVGAGGQGSEADQPGSGNEKKIISFASAFNKHNEFSLQCVLDIDADKAHKTAKTRDCDWYCEPWEMDYILKKHKIDIVVISTPDNTHYEYLKQLAEYPLRLVICEKPLCETVDQAKEIIGLYKQKNIPLMVNYTRRFLPYYDHLKQYGKPIYASCKFNNGWLHTATHAIDFFEMLGCENYDLREVQEEFRVWAIIVIYENYEFKEKRIADMPVWDYYDKSHWHVVENAYNFLEGKEELKCTGEDALKALEICYELMGNNNEQ